MSLILPSLLDMLDAKSLVPLAIVLLATFLILRRRPRQHALSEPSETTQRQPSQPTSQHERIRRDLESLLVELQ